MPYVKSHDRNQMFMTSLDMLVDPDSHARIIDAFIDSLDLKEMGFTHTAPSEVGRPAYDVEVVFIRPSEQHPIFQKAGESLSC